LVSDWRFGCRVSKALEKVPGCWTLSTLTGRASCAGAAQADRLIRFQPRLLNRKNVTEMDLPVAAPISFSESPA
jgi:hypothetical protein